MSITEFLICIELGIIFGIAALGVYLTFRVIDFPDLTCDGSFMLGAVVSTILIKLGFNPFLSLAFAFLCGNIAGLFTGVLKIYLGITDILSGILVSYMLYSINLKIMGGIPNISLINEVTAFTENNSLIILGIISSFCVLMLSYLLISRFGLALRTIGQSKSFALNNNINVNLMTKIGLIISNGFIALSGAILSQYQGFTDISQGTGTIVTALAAVIIGGHFIVSKSPWVLTLSCILGSIIYRCVIALSLNSDVLGLETYDCNLITGLIIILIIFTYRKRILC